jgi:hypothetical protein
MIATVGPIPGLAHTRNRPYQGQRSPCQAQPIHGPCTTTFMPSPDNGQPIPRPCPAQTSTRQAQPMPSLFHANVQIIPNQCQAQATHAQPSSAHTQPNRIPAQPSKYRVQDCPHLSFPCQPMTCLRPCQNMPKPDHNQAGSCTFQTMPGPAQGIPGQGQTMARPSKYNASRSPGKARPRPGQECAEA